MRALLAKRETHLIVLKDEPGNYLVVTRRIQKNRQPLYFGAVQIKKNYVSYHLFPVYVYPDFLGGISPELQVRMQGKACFNFKRADATLFCRVGESHTGGFRKV